LLSALVEQTTEHRTEWVGEGYMGYQFIFEECTRPLTGAVYELVGDHKVQRLKPLFQATYGTDGYNPFDSQGLESIYVGPDGESSRTYAMASTVARQESDLHTLQIANGDDVARVAEWSVYLHVTHVGQVLHLVEAAAANYRNSGFSHDSTYIPLTVSDKLSV
jgi:hypothetical protein